MSLLGTWRPAKIVCWNVQNRGAKAVSERHDSQWLTIVLTQKTQLFPLGNSFMSHPNTQDSFYFVEINRAK